MNVIAEGAETKEQVDFLHGNACHDVQGYYYYKPMPAGEIEKVLININEIGGNFSSISGIMYLTLAIYLFKINIKKGGL